MGVNEDSLNSEGTMDVLVLVVKPQTEDRVTTMALVSAGTFLKGNKMFQPLSWKRLCRENVQLTAPF